MTSSSVTISETIVVAAKTFLWVTTTPLGLPVEPLVYMITAQVSGVGGTTGNAFVSPALTKSSNERTFTPAGAAGMSTISSGATMSLV